MIHAQEGTRGLLQTLLKQEKCSLSGGDGLDETHTNDKVVTMTEKDASRDARMRRFFTRSALPKAGTCLFCMKHGYT